MSTLIERINERLEAAGLTANAASELAGSPSIIPNILNGRSKNPRIDTIEKIAKVLQCSADWLSTGKGPVEEGVELSSEVAPAEARMPYRSETPRDVPVLGTAAGSALGQGAFQLSTDVVEYVGRPRGLITAVDIYALYVEGESMSPKFEPGDLVFVTPHRKPRVGDDVIVQEPDSNNGEAQAFIKRLVSITATTIRTRQFNPPANIDFIVRPGLRVHRVVPVNELYGL